MALIGNVASGLALHDVDVVDRLVRALEDVRALLGRREIARDADQRAAEVHRVDRLGAGRVVQVTAEDDERIGELRPHARDDRLSGLRLGEAARRVVRRLRAEVRAEHDDRLVAERHAHLEELAREGRLRAVGLDQRRLAVRLDLGERAAREDADVDAAVLPVSPRWTSGYVLPHQASFAASASRQPSVSTSSSVMTSGSISAMASASCAIRASKAACVTTSSKLVVLVQSPLWQTASK